VRITKLPIPASALLSSSHWFKVIYVCTAGPAANCTVCNETGSLRSMVMCCSCGIHYHSTCMAISSNPGNTFVLTYYTILSCKTHTHSLITVKCLNLLNEFQWIWIITLCSRGNHGMDRRVVVSDCLVQLKQWKSNFEFQGSISIVCMFIWRSQRC